MGRPRKEPTPKDHAVYPYILEQIQRARGESMAYKVHRGGEEVLRFDPKDRLYEIARDTVQYLNRDRREIVFVEDRMIIAEKRLAEISKLCGLLIGNLEWCRENTEQASDAKTIDGWVKKARKFTAEILKGV